MPEGKPAGVACVNLDEHFHCKIFLSPERPALCASFQAETSVCGENRNQALHLIQVLEMATQ